MSITFCLHKRPHPATRAGMIKVADDSKKPSSVTSKAFGYLRLPFGSMD